MLETRGLSYHKKNGSPVIQGITYSFNPGKIYAIVGPNGSGKTTLLKLLTGIWLPNAGKILWKGQNLITFQRKERSRILSLVPQRPQIVFNYTVQEIVEMGYYPHAKEAKSASVDEALDLMGILHLKNREVTQLSVGELQRVYITRSYLSQTPVLLLDEPTANLDLKHQLAIWMLLERLKNSQRIIIISSHDFDAVKKHADCTILLDKGQIVASGSYDQVITEQSLLSTFDVRIRPDPDSKISF